MIERKACLHECTDLFTVKRPWNLLVWVWPSCKSEIVCIWHELRTQNPPARCLLPSVLSVLILARCSPLMFSPIQVMRVNLARLLMASPVCDPYKPKETVVIWESKRKKSLKLCHFLDSSSFSFIIANCLKNVKCVTIWINHIHSQTFAEKSQLNWRLIRLYSGRQERLWKVALEVIFFLNGITRVQITDRFTTNKNYSTEW